MKDQLYLLQPGFFDGAAGPFYCGDSVAVEGLLSFCPALREQVDVHYLPFAKPRAALVAALGAAHQSAPVLVLAGDAAGTAAQQAANGRHYIDSEAEIRRYLSARYGAASAK